MPVPLPAETYHAYYGQISNEVLWMLQHHVIGSGGFEYLDYARHQAWGRYLEANARLAAAIARSGRQPRAFLVQDYHLYPLPDLLRGDLSRHADPALHPHPVPRSAGAAADPRSLAADDPARACWAPTSSGCRRRMDVRSFLSCCAEFLDVARSTPTRGVVQMPDGREVRVRAYPASVEPRALRRTMRSPEVAAAHTRLAADRGER